MKLFSHLLSHLSQTSRHLLRMLALVPLLAVSTPSHAEEDIDNRNGSVEFSQAELDQILAPIALYPDTVLSQVLIAATYPIEVVQASRWASNNSRYKGADAVAKVEDKDWDPSVKALVAFPDILQRMSDDIDWTQKLGDAFLTSEERVMDSIQSLRKKAYASGSLNKVQHLKVQRDADEIIIEPAEERIVYVPVYDTRVVYGNWWWPEYPPVYWHHPTSYIQVSGFYWGPSIFIGPTFFFSSCHWHSRRVVVVDRHYVQGPRPVFYTSRSIVTYQSARPWRHEPVHRRGVAYYNNDLRTRYGSQRESYRDARAYREDRREQQSPRQRSFNDGNYTPPRSLNVDRSEQLRERMTQRNGNSERNPNNNQITRPLPQTDRNNRSDTPPRQQDINRRSDHINEPGRATQTEQDLRTQLRAQRENQATNNLGAVRPTLVQPDRNQAETETSNNARVEALRNREMHNDGRNTRQISTERAEQNQRQVEQRSQSEERPVRQERPVQQERPAQQERPLRQEERQERREIQSRGNSRSDEERQIRVNR